MKLYFAYGANLNTLGMRDRCADAVEVMPWYLKDHRLTFSGVASIQPAPGERVAGAIWAISEEDERNLDIFEGYPTFYRKEVVLVDGMEVMYYRMNSEQPSEPSTNYLMIIAEGYQDWDLDLAYLRDAVETTQEEAYDLYRSTSHSRGSGRFDTILADDVYLEPGDGLRWFRRDGLANRDTETV